MHSDSTVGSTYNKPLISRKRFQKFFIFKQQYIMYMKIGFNDSLLQAKIWFIQESLLKWSQQ